ncbi:MULTISPECIES: superoxide dismutase family protein [Bacillus cereus group]|uniref:Superoxide dismutase [Cu-Zn] n=1 Tax=Bacillus cytotoxicus (strain DSM 22905 / CIP 110041 / 391-98 / NVH 391-98) TaxID=315749 RepID=A7GUB5_BACCN|nr:MULTISPECIES: superoxide dismutase family protein [Bacillus cereus group]ABS23723.1 superoxide dismutase copper/zinc binding [Bacillus cytotoxicus NVH 391-98]AWC30311.1 superoxide dismutase family protein [Bacillus cytotoxicus]AWC42451.1 superoxide dismutase family protein [Bacillus cytotoxicus]AWC46336.1 superoxide dismutase family protein [Bacillus cytotoxicus]AWC50382.1 superoxide dismutase family protein [Bacillus cytotoxicus]
MKKQLLFSCCMLVLITGCDKGNSKEIDVKLYNASGDEVGTAKVTQQTSGVKISIKADGFTPGAHGLHIHEMGECKAPRFESAGNHFNVDDKKKHGLMNPKGAENGDLPNVIADDTGKIKAEIEASNVSLEEGRTTLYRKDGASIIITENPDDGMTQPTGNSGNRIACGVIVKKVSANKQK